MKTPSVAALLPAFVLVGAFLSAPARGDPGRQTAASKAFVEGRPLMPEPADDEALKRLVEQAVAVQQGRSAADPPELFAAAIGAVCDKFKLDARGRERALKLYRDRVRPAGEAPNSGEASLMSEAAEKYLRNPDVKPAVAARISRRLDAYAKALGELRADDGAVGAAPGGPGGGKRPMNTAELDALSRIPRARVAPDMSRIRPVAAPETEPAAPNLAQRGAADLQRSEAIVEDGTIGAWARKKGLFIGGLGKVVGAKLSEAETYSDWWKDAGYVAGGFTPGSDFVAWKEGPGALYLGGKAIATGVVHEFTNVYSQGKIYLGRPTPSQGMELASAFGMAGLNLVGFGAPGAAKAAAAAELKAVAGVVAKATLEEAAEVAAKAAVAKTAKEAVEATAAAAARDAAAAELAAAAKAAAAAKVRAGVIKRIEGAFDASVRELGKDPATLGASERKALLADYLKRNGMEDSAISAALQRETARSKVIAEFSARHNVPEDTVEKALIGHVESQGGTMREIEALTESQQMAQFRMQVLHPDFVKQPPIAAVLQTNIVGLDGAAQRAAKAALERSASYSKLMVVDGSAVAQRNVRFFRHVYGEELSRSIAEKGLAPRAFKDGSVDFGRILNEAGGAEGLVKLRVIDNPTAKSVLYEFTEHADRAGLGAGVTTAGPIKIEIIPRPGQSFISTNGYAQELLGKSERGWATMDAIAIEQIVIYGAGCPSGCRLVSNEGMALARALTSR